MNSTLSDLKESAAQLNTSLSDIRTNLEQSLKDPLCSAPAVTATCNDIRMTLTQLDDNTNMDQVRGATLLQGSVVGTAGQGYAWVHLSGARWPGSLSAFPVL